jgi:N-acyl homoserine lactone hydrolase
MNVSRDQSVASMQRIATALADKKATLRINHDKPQSDTLRYAPAFYR